MTFHDKRFLLLLGLMAVVGFAIGSGAYLFGWTAGYREATAVQERGWNQVAYGVDNRRTGADLERLLGRAMTEGCQEQLYDLERPVPLLMALQRATRESECLTAGFRSETDALNRPGGPTELPGGQVKVPAIRRLAWTDWRPSWLGGAALRRADLLPLLQAKFPRLDLVVEYPFAGDGAWVTLGGCLADGTEARSARKALYAVSGVTVVFDRTTRTPKHDPDVPRYVDSACSSHWLHDGRGVAKQIMTPGRAQDPQAERRMPLATLIPDADHRARVLTAMEIGEDLEAKGVHALAMALHEIHKVVHGRMWDGITAQERLSYVRMMFDVWARMPAPGTEKAADSPPCISEPPPGRLRTGVKNAPWGEC